MKSLKHRHYPMDMGHNPEARCYCALCDKEIRFNQESRRWVIVVLKKLPVRKKATPQPGAAMGDFGSHPCRESDDKVCRICKKRPILRKPSKDNPFWDVCNPCMKNIHEATDRRDAERADEYSSSAGYGGWGHDE
jgi:hypothetical protein